MKKKLLLLLIVIPFALTGCRSPFEKITTDRKDPRLEFETFYKGYLYLNEGDFSCSYYGYKYPENTFIQTEEQLASLVEKTGFPLKAEEIDFDQYLLYINTADTIDDSDRLPTFDISEMSYNDDTFDVLINYRTSEYIPPKENRWICFYNISKVKKENFPLKERDYIKHSES